MNYQLIRESNHPAMMINASIIINVTMEPPVKLALLYAAQILRQANLSFVIPV
jgi:hypothetical protein